MNEQKVYRTIALILGIYVLSCILPKIYFQARFPGEWIRVVGIIERSYVQPRKWIYETVIEYEYQVQGRNYSGKALSPLSAKHWEVTESSAQGFLRSYPVGKYVEVYVHPQKPEISSLDLYLGRNSWEGLLQFFSLCWGLLLLGYAVVGNIKIPPVNNGSGGSAYIDHVSRVLRRPFRQK